MLLIFQGSLCFRLSATTSKYYHIHLSMSTTFFIFFQVISPLLTAYSLSRGAPSTAWVLLQYQALELSLCMKVSGERGIRTLAPFRTNGFQDRLVMTASISLQVVFVRRHQPATCTYYHFTIFVSTSFFKKFEAIFKSSGVVIFRFSYAPIITFVLTLL